MMTSESHRKELLEVFNKYHGRNGNRWGFTSAVFDEKEKDLLVEAIIYFYADQAEVKEDDNMTDPDTETMKKCWIVTSHGYKAW